LKNKIILIGGGGHCLSCIEIIEGGGEFEIAGIIDKKEKPGSSVLNYQIIGTDNDLQELIRTYKYF
jgi:FlaA1/EpsC-like NDP-sugar epimerase